MLSDSISYRFCVAQVPMRSSNKQAPTPVARPNRSTVSYVQRVLGSRHDMSHPASSLGLRKGAL